MTTVIFNTESGIFKFARPDVFECLQHHKTRNNFQEASDIEKYLSHSPSGPITIPDEYDYFINIALELIKNGKGTVTCKRCDKTYQASDLKSVPIGQGRSPLNQSQIDEIQEFKLRDIFRKKWIKAAIENFRDQFRKRQPQPGMFGGKGWRCPEGHDLLSIIIWRT